MKYFFPLFILTISCLSASKKKEPAPVVAKGPAAPTEISQRDQLMDSTLCDGFDFPVGDAGVSRLYRNADGSIRSGWQVIKTTGRIETWSGRGAKDSETSQPVYAVATGKVIYTGQMTELSGNTIQLEHSYAENGSIIRVFSEYRGLGEMYVKKGDLVKRRQKIAAAIDTTGNTAYIDFAMGEREFIPQTYMDASDFIKTHRKINVPFKRNKLVLIDKSEFKCYLYNKGNLVRTYEIALGQVPVGRKEKQGDLKVPEGEYSICEKTRGPFTHNWSAAYLGTRWMCLTYPNTYDAQIALNEKRITKEQYNKIEQATKAGIKPPQNTPLGGGIGLHGWIEEDWSNDSDRAQTWGCVSFHNNDLNDFYERVDLKTTVIIVR